MTYDTTTAPVPTIQGIAVPAEVGRLHAAATEIVSAIEDLPERYHRLLDRRAVEALYACRADAREVARICEIGADVASCRGSNCPDCSDRPWIAQWRTEVPRGYLLDVVA